MLSDEQIDALIDSLPRQPYGTGSRREDCRELVREVHKQDDALILQLVEALERAKKHHFTTSLPLVIENYGSRIKCANEGSIVWRDLVPSAITAARTRLENT